MMALVTAGRVIARKLLPRGIVESLYLTLLCLISILIFVVNKKLTLLEHSLANEVIVAIYSV